ncbi:FAD:protein FMN transferase [Rudaea sp.]|uniref:FAD:protein FMN transferase n=1 Tax=Rudaea sp. TaxID=2136325 RepID=UPI002ED53471
MDLHRYAFSSMGCPCEIQLETDFESGASAAAAKAQAEVARLDEKYSHYRSGNWLACLCASAGSGRAVELDEEATNLVDFAAALHAQSAGRFDITAGALTKLWDLQSGRVPAQAQIDEALARTGWHRVEWRRPYLTLPIAGMHIDFGGVVKEYAADRAAEICRQNGVAHGVVDLGGDLAVIGAHADGSAWLAGIKAPRSPEKVYASIELDRGGLATSGDYERVMIVDGKRYSHIVDPLRGRPVESFASVSVLADSCLVAGAASTLAMLLGVERGAEYLRELDLPWLALDADGRARGNIESAT